MLRIVVLQFLAFLVGCSVVGYADAQSFIENNGQLRDQFGKINPNVNFYANYGSFRIFLNKQGFSYEIIKSETKNRDQDTIIPIEFNRVDIAFLNTSFSGVVEKEQLVTKEKFYREMSLYESNSFRKVTYKNVYPKIDVVFFANNDGFKYDFVVHPGADLSAIQLEFNSSFETALSESGIQIQTPLGAISERVPYSYFKESDEEISVEFIKSQTAEKANVFQFAASNKRNSFLETLVIDPMPNVWFATYISGNLDEFPENVVLDHEGDSYVVGYTNSVNNIATAGTFQGTFQAVYDVFLVKYRPDGTKLWGTYLGSDSFDRAYGLFYKNGFVYLCGNSFSQNFATPGVHQTINMNGDDAFLAKFDLEGNRIWTTYYGGEAHDFASSVVVNNSNEIYITGHTLSYSNIATANAHTESFFGISAAFLAKFSSQGQLIWGTYYGSSFDEGYGIALDSDEHVVFSGYSSSSNGIASPGSQQTSNAGGFDAFLTKFTPTGSRLWGTYFGGPADDKGYAVCIDAADNIYMVGNTSSLSGISSGTGFQLQAGSIDDGFIAKYNANGNRLWSSYVGGSEAEYINAVSLYFDQSVVIAGQTQSNANIATNGALQANLAGQYDAFMMKISPSGALEWGTYFGGTQSDEFTGLAIDASNGFIHTSGLTLSANGIATSNAHQTDPGSGLFHGFLARFCAPFVPNLITEIQAVSCGNSNYSIDVIPSDIFVDFLWHDSTSAPFYHFTNLSQGQYFYFLNTIDTNNCSFKTDTIFFQVLPDVAIDLAILYDQNTPFCQGAPFSFSANNAFENYTWSNGSNSGQSTCMLETVGEQILWLTVTDTNGCMASDTLIFQVLESPQPSIQTSGAANFCLGESVIASTSDLYFSYLWSNGDTTPQTTIIEDTWIWVEATNEYGCSAVSDSVFISATDLVPVITLLNNPPICPNSELSFELNNIFNSQVWSTGQTTNTIQVPAIPGEQWIAVEVQNLCGGWGADTLWYTVAPTIDFSIHVVVPDLLCVGSQVFGDVSSSFFEVLWQNSYSGSTYSEIATEFGTWMLIAQALDENLCPVYDTLLLDVDSCVLDIDTQVHFWKFYPNPVSEKLTIESSTFLMSHVELLDSRGTLIETRLVNGNSVYLDMSKYSSGIYVIKIFDSSSQFVKAERVIVNRK